MTASRPEVSIVVPNWEGWDWLRRCLSALQVAGRRSGLAHEIIVVDDASGGDLVASIRESYPRVKVLENPRNLGFARSVNRGALEAQGRYLVLCNNDLLPREDFITRIIQPFGSDRAGRLFAVSAKTVGWYDGKPNQLCMGGVWKGGRVTPAWSDPKALSRCLFVQAGAAAYRRDLWMKLGGLSTLFEPGYWEDYDLSWRAAKAGLRSLYEPDAFALHVGGGSMSRRYGSRGVAVMKARNHLLFEAANLTSPRLLAEWSARLPLALSRAGTAAPEFLTAAGEAASRLPQALAQRMRLSGRVSDSDILAPWRRFHPSF